MRPQNIKPVSCSIREMRAEETGYISFHCGAYSRSIKNILYRGDVKAKYGRR